MKFYYEYHTSECVVNLWPEDRYDDAQVIDTERFQYLVATLSPWGFTFVEYVADLD